jgi:hypothetical protein
VLNNITYNDHGNVRPLFWRLSIAEMVVPYGCPEFPHTRKHAFDLGEYGAGFMANSLALGCDCKGAISYLDASFNLRNGDRMRSGTRFVSMKKILGFFTSIRISERIIRWSRELGNWLSVKHSLQPIMIISCTYISSC